MPSPASMRAASARQAVTSLQQRSVPQTLLLVEDSRLAAEAVRLTCRRLGIRLRRAETLASAALHLRVYRPDVALVDLGLPDGSGLSLIAALARHAQHTGRVVAISGDPAMASASLEAGADAFIEKPLNPRHHLAPLFGIKSLAEVSAPAPEPPMATKGAMIRAAFQPHGPDPGIAFRSDGQVAGNDAAWPRNTEADGRPASAPHLRPGAGGDGNGERLRNMGGDPMALSDDLRRAHRLLLAARDASEICYVSQFLGGVARCARDGDLLHAARQTRQSGDTALLLAALAERMAEASLL